MLINIYPRELRYYQFIIGIERCSASCNTFNYLSDKTFVPRKLKDVNVKVSDVKNV